MGVWKRIFILEVILSKYKINLIEMRANFLVQSALVSMVSVAMASAWSANRRQYYQPSPSDKSFSGRLADNFKQTLSVDMDKLYDGVFDPSNAAIHVAQNALNFFGSSAMWVLLATLGGRGRGEEEPAARSAEEPVIFHKPISNFVGSKRVIKKRRMQRNLVNQMS